MFVGFNRNSQGRQVCLYVKISAILQIEWRTFVCCYNTSGEYMIGGIKILTNSRRLGDRKRIKNNLQFIAAIIKFVSVLYLG